MYIGQKDGYRYNSYAATIGNPRPRTYKRLLGGQAELAGVKRGQVWEIERHKGKPWQLYEVTSISMHPGGNFYNKARYVVYLHHLKSRRLIVKTIGAFVKKKGCRLVSEAPPDASHPPPVETSG